MTSAATWTVGGVLRWAVDDFRSRGIDTPRLDAELLLARALGTNRVGVIVEAEKVLGADQLQSFRELVKRRRAREPTAYILGEREFYGRKFRVDRRVLVPRPDTEALVEVALRRTTRLSLSMRALDLCTGSGCVAVTLARERPTCSVIGADVSPEAIVVARDNALRLGAYNVAFRDGDLFDALDGRRAFDVITANAPYVPEGDLDSLPADVRDYEPHVALRGGYDGLALLRRIVSTAPSWLAPGGVLALEVGAGQAHAVVELFARAAFTGIERHRDYARIERVVSGIRC